MRLHKDTQKPAEETASSRGTRVSELHKITAGCHQPYLCYEKWNGKPKPFVEL